MKLESETAVTLGMDRDLFEGARNLLVNCAEMQADESLLVLHEDAALGWYDGALPRALAMAAERLGLRTTLMQVAEPRADLELPPSIAAAMADHDQTVFFARIGDQSRFRQQLTEKAPVMSYVREAAGLASMYGRFDHRAFLDLKAALNYVYDNAAQIRITCPLGTDLSGRALVDPSGPEDVSIKRFPMGVYKPISCAGFSGRVALSRYLVSTGSRSYSPDSAAFGGVVFAMVEGNRITAFEGPAESVATIETHYKAVSDLFAIEPLFVHSWHSGMHPACSYPGRADDNPDRWGNTAFTNPRLLHFHTCGAFPPGEISWTLIDPQVDVDGVVLWRAGRLNLEANDVIRHVFATWPGLTKLFSQPPGDIGL